MFTFLSSGVSLLMANVSTGHGAPHVSLLWLVAHSPAWPPIGQSPLPLWAPEVLRPGAGDGSSWLLLPLSHFSVSRPSSHYTRQTNKYKSPVHNIYIARPHSLDSLSQSDLINSWHKTGRNAKPHTPGHSTGGGANLWGRVFIRVSKTSGNSIIERLVWPPRMMKLTIFELPTPEPPLPWHLMVRPDEAGW